ncbi:MAG: ABC transporter ATP-binding protein [Clostridiales bacterium]|nr:ABC transporter ATP-binding protein [Clostridiales bacterium]
MYRMSITLNDVSKRFGTKTLFSSLDCTVSSGECLVVTGRNGSGKSTLLKIIARLLKPSSGRVEIRADKTLLRHFEQSLPYIGLISPELAFYDQLTGGENIGLLARARGLEPVREDISRALRAVNLENFSNKYLATYSTGMIQRLRFALLSLIDPPIWLIDEGLSNLDSDGQAMVLALIEARLKQGHLIAMATNGQSEVAYASQIIALP